jgi:hypothetical protein
MVKLGDKEIFLDPTAKKLEFSIPPFSIQGTEVFVISGESGYFTQIPLWDADSNQIASFITLNINNDLEIDGKLGVIYKGQEEWFMRMYLEKIEPKQREEFVHSVLTNVYPGAIVKNYTVKHEDDLDEDLEIEINFSLSNWLEKAGKVYLLKFIDDKMTSPPEYLSLERKFPIKKAYKGMTKSRIEINLPAKFFIEDLPQDFTIESDYLSSSIRYKKFNNKIVREQVIKFLILDIPVNDVIKYKDLYEKIFKAHKQAIVLAESN